MSASSGVHEPSWDGEDPSLQGGHGGLLKVVSGEAADGAAEVVRPSRPGASQAALAMNLPDGRCASPALLSSAIRCSTTAWRRWSASTSSTPPGRKVGEGVVVPGGEQRQQGSGGGADPAHDQPHLDGVLSTVAAGGGGVGGLRDVGAGDFRRGQPVRDRRPRLLSMASIAARIFLSCRAVIENCTSNFTAVASTARL